MNRTLISACRKLLFTSPIIFLGRCGWAISEKYSCTAKSDPAKKKQTDEQTASMSFLWYQKKFLRKLLPTKKSHEQPNDEKKNSCPPQKIVPSPHKYHGPSLKDVLPRPPPPKKILRSSSFNFSLKMPIYSPLKIYLLPVVVFILSFCLLPLGMFSHLLETKQESWNAVATF